VGNSEAQAIQIQQQLKNPDHHMSLQEIAEHAKKTPKQTPLTKPSSKHKKTPKINSRPSGLAEE